jgi:hypothetical protein
MTVLGMPMSTSMLVSIERRCGELQAALFGRCGPWTGCRTARAHHPATPALFSAVVLAFTGRSP